MSVFNRIPKHRRNTFGFIGAYLYLPVHHYLTLYTLAKEVGKAEIIRGLLEDWMKQQRIKETDLSLIRQIVDRIYKQWHLKKLVNPKEELDDFLEEVEQELVDKGIETKYVVIISSEIRNKDGKNEKV